MRYYPPHEISRPILRLCTRWEPIAWGVSVELNLVSQVPKWPWHSFTRSIMGPFKSQLAFENLTITDSKLGSKYYFPLHFGGFTNRTVHRNWYDVRHCHTCENISLKKMGKSGWCGRTRHLAPFAPMCYFSNMATPFHITGNFVQTTWTTILAN